MMGMIRVRMINGEKFNLDMTIREFYVYLGEQLDDFGFSCVFNDYAIRPKHIVSIQEYED
jgi:hypothetical protein